MFRQYSKINSSLENTIVLCRVYLCVLLQAPSSFYMNNIQLCFYTYNILHSSILIFSDEFFFLIFIFSILTFFSE